MAREDDTLPVQSGILDPLVGMGFFSPNMSLEEIKRRRAIGAAIASRGRPFPKTIGEGLTYFGEALAEGRAERQLIEAEKAHRVRDEAGATPFLPGAAPAAAPLATVPPVPPPVAAAPASAVARPSPAPVFRAAPLAAADPLTVEPTTGPASRDAIAQTLERLRIARLNNATGTAGRAPVPPGPTVVPSPNAGAAPDGATFAEEGPNPPTVTDAIKPMLVAEAKTPTRAPATALPDDYEYPEPTPAKPIQRMSDHPLEAAARRAVATQDPSTATYRAAAEFLKKQDDDRKFYEAREVTRYNADVQREERERTEKRKWDAERQGRVIDLRQKELNTVKTEQEIAAGKLQKVGENDRVLRFDEKGVLKDITPQHPTSASGAPRVKLTETQAKTFDNLQKADIAYEQYKRIPDADKVLSQGLADELAGRVPFFNNSLLSSRYRRARNAALNITAAHLRETSGAAIGVAEEANTIAQLFPKYGDDTGVLKQKAALREGIVGGMKLKLGTAAPLAEYATAERAKADAAEQAKIDAEMKDAPKVVGKIYKNGNKRRFWTGSRWEDD